MADNGTNFVSQEFETFLRKNGIEGSIEDKLSHLLFYIHITPQTPAEQLQGCCLRSMLDLIKPDLDRKMKEKPGLQKHYFDSHKRLRSFEVGQPVYVRNFGQGRKWLLGQILQSAGLVTLMIQLSDDRVYKHHINHIRSRQDGAEEHTSLILIEFDPETEIDTSLPIELEHQTETSDLNPEPDPFLTNPSDSSNYYHNHPPESPVPPEPITHVISPVVRRYPKKKDQMSRLVYTRRFQKGRKRFSELNNSVVVNVY